MTSQTFSSIAEVQAYLRRYAKARDWEKFHAPKNLSMALAVEAAELMEIFQWLPEAGVELEQEQRENIRSEMADVFMYLLRMADVLDVDLLEAVQDKAELNEARYPADRVKGSSKKYTHYT
ncbi:NTP pyrophosphatase, house-cleaning of non-canonical NTPs [Alteromonadaceae bacterium Bs31]|nr:NTP pyrophosphatase, house-cleaning of non-canonical NTPs [Alteromonadaceae bacterium Bs31]